MTQSANDTIIIIIIVVASTICLGEKQIRKVPPREEGGRLSTGDDNKHWNNYRALIGRVRAQTGVLFFFSSFVRFISLLQGCRTR